MRRTGPSVTVRRMFLLAAPIALALALVAPQPASAASCNSKGACVLVFLTQPADAKAGNTITSSVFNPAGTAMQVQLQFASSGAPVTGQTDSIQIGLIPAPTNTDVGHASNNVVSLDPLTGTATFTGLSVDTHGTYALAAADKSNNRVTGGTSGGFTIWDDVKDCASNACQSNLNQPDENANFSIASNNGILAATLGGFNKSTFLAGCGARPKDQFGPSVGDVELLAGTGLKTVTVTYSKAYVLQQANNGSSFYQICVALDGGQTFQDINNNTTSIGLIPGPCGSTSKPFSKDNPIVPPCWQSKTKNVGNGTVQVIFLLPADDRFCC